MKPPEIRKRATTAIVVIETTLKKVFRNKTVSCETKKGTIPGAGAVHLPLQCRNMESQWNTEELGRRYLPTAHNNGIWTKKLDRRRQKDLGVQ